MQILDEDRRISETALMYNNNTSNLSLHIHKIGLD